MSRDPKQPGEPLSISRWSKRKLEAARAQRSVPAQAPEAGDNAPASPAASAVPLAPAPKPAAAAATTPLPPPESLPPDADFTAYFALRGEAGEPLRRAALKQVLRDPRFNVMDGLDVYIDDYTKPAPIPDDMLQSILRAGGFLESAPGDSDSAGLEIAPAPGGDGQAPASAPGPGYRELPPASATAPGAIAPSPEAAAPSPPAASADGPVATPDTVQVKPAA